MEEDRDRSMSDSHEIELQPDNHGPEDSVIEVCQTTLIEEDSVFSKIKADLSSSSSSTKQSKNCKIRKVQPHDHLPRDNTMSAYTPKIISIGPLHHGEDELKPMGDAKHKYLNKLLNRRHEYRNYELSSDGKNDELLGRFIAATRKMEEEVQGYYELSNINTISSDDFVRMLVIDGCFLLEFLLRQHYERKSDDLGLQWPRISHDILLFENQIPFFILQAFYKILTEYGVYESSTMADVACRYLYNNRWENHMTFLGSNFSRTIYGTGWVPSNLLHLHHMMLFKRSDMWFRNHIVIVRKWTMKLFSWLFAFVSSPMYLIHKIFFADITYPTKLISATEIEEAGVRLQCSRMDLRFEEGTLLIPALTLNQQSFFLLKNLMAFEFYFRSDRVIPYVHTYVSYLSLLIKNPGDLKVMEKHHIIITGGGGDESFALVNELIQTGFEELVSDEAHVGFSKGMMSDIYNWQSPYFIIHDLKTYCKEPRHRWRAKLMKDYFGNPWSTLGVLGGVILLVLTTLQTAFTLLSYYHQ